MIPFIVTPYSELFGIGAVLAVMSAVWTSRQKGEPTRFLVRTELAVAFWSLMYAIAASAQIVDYKYFWTSLTYIGVAVTPFWYFLFVLSYCQLTHWISPRRVLLFHVFPISFFLIVLTNPWHHLFFTGISIDPSTNLAIFGHGPLYWGFLIFNYLLLAGGALILLRTIWRNPGLYRTQAIYLLLGALVPFSGSLFYLSGASPLPGFDWTLLGFLAGTLMLSLAIGRSPLFRLVPLARGQVLDYIADGMIIIDHEGQVVDLNASARRLLNLPGKMIGAPANFLADFGIQVRSPNDLPAVDEVCLSGLDGQILEVSQTIVAEQAYHHAGILLILREITQRKQAQKRLEELNHNLETIVAERTVQLSELVRSLEAENRARNLVEGELRGLRDNLANQVFEQSRNLAAIYELIISGGQSTGEVEMMRQALARICALFHSQAGSIHELDPENEVFRMVADAGLDVPQRRAMGTISQDWLRTTALTFVGVNPASEGELPEPLREAGFATLMSAPIRARGTVTGVMTIFWTDPYPQPVEQIAFFTALAEQVGIVKENINLREQHERAAVQEERRRLARDLHDSVTQSLHSLVMASDTALFRLTQGRIGPLANSLEHISESAAQALKDMRLMLYELRLVPLEEIELVQAVETRLESVERRAGIHAEIVADENIDWPPHWQGETYAIIMEALNNALKHARASNVRVEVEQDHGKIRVTVEDDGVGFDPTSKLFGIGLKSMAERAEKLGGTLDLKTQVGQGTSIQLILNLQVYERLRELV
jgi:signal transduction histidine kinase